MSAPEIAFWAVTIAVGLAALAWGVHLYRVERDTPSQSERLLGGGRR